MFCVCKNQRLRTKNLKPYFYCIEKKKQVNQDCYKKCLKFNSRANKGIKKVSSKRKVVSKETYNKVFERDKGLCRICGNYQIELHHIVYRSEDKNLIDEPSNCIMLCKQCHRLVHSNKKEWQPYLKNLIRGE